MYICIYVYMYIPGWWQPTACAPGPSSAPAPATELGESSLLNAHRPAEGGRRPNPRPGTASQRGRR